MAKCTMGGMLWCFTRIVSVFGLVVLIGTAVVAQFWEFMFRTPNVYFLVGLQGVYFNFPFDSGTASGWHTKWYHTAWSVNNLLLPPRITHDSMAAVVSVPWWLLLPAWGVLTAVVWRLTRQKQGGGAFPVELAVK